MIEFYKAVKAMIPTKHKVHLFDDGIATSPTIYDYPYVMLWGDTGWDYSGEAPELDSLADVDDAVEIRIRATMAGLGADAFSIIHKAVRDALSDKRPTVTGWRCERLARSPLVDAQADLDVTVSGIHPIFAADEYVLTATRI